jgi:hypothetical protein
MDDFCMVALTHTLFQHHRYITVCHDNTTIVSTHWQHHNCCQSAVVVHLYQLQQYANSMVMKRWCHCCDPITHYMGAQKTDIVRAYEYVRIGGAEGEHRNVQLAVQAYPSRP